MFGSSEQTPNQFQVFRETQRGSSVPGAEPESGTAPWVLQLHFLALSLEQLQSPKHWAHGLREEISEWTGPAGRVPILYLLQQSWQGLRGHWAPEHPSLNTRILHLPCSKDSVKCGWKYQSLRPSRCSVNEWLVTWRELKNLLEHINTKKVHMILLPQA